MDQSDTRQVVASGYDDAVDRYLALEGESWPRTRWLRSLLDRLPAGSAVLDVGCGAGEPADREIAVSHQITGVDVSPVHIERAREAVPSGTFRCADMSELEFAAESFDAIVTFYAIDHVPREEYTGLFAKFRHWLKPGGWLLVATEDWDEPGAVHTWLGTPMFFSTFPAEVTRRLIADAGLVVDHDDLEEQREGGHPVRYYWVLARRNASSEHAST